MAQPVRWQRLRDGLPRQHTREGRRSSHAGAAALVASAGQIGLQASDFEREFSAEGQRFRITGIDTRRSKYPISAERLSDGRLYKFPSDDVIKLLAGHSSTTHPQG